MPIHLGTDPRNHTRSLDNFHYPSKDLNNETVLLDGANPEFSFTVRSAGSFDDRPLVDTPYISSRYILLPYSAQPILRGLHEKNSVVSKHRYSRSKVYFLHTLSHFLTSLTQNRWFSVTYSCSFIGRNKPSFLSHVLKICYIVFAIREGIYIL